MYVTHYLVQIDAICSDLWLNPCIFLIINLGCSSSKEDFFAWFLRGGILPHSSVLANPQNALSHQATKQKTSACFHITRPAICHTHCEYFMTMSTLGCWHCSRTVLGWTYIFMVATRLPFSCVTRAPGFNTHPWYYTRKQWFGYPFLTEGMRVGRCVCNGDPTIRKWHHICRVRWKRAGNAKR